MDALFGLYGLRRGLFFKSIERCARLIEKLLLARFDYVSTISTAMLDRLSEKGVLRERQVFFPNWSDLSAFKDANADESLLAAFEVPTGKRVILYSGNVGDKQGLDNVIYAAERMRSRADLIFLIVGAGSSLESLKELTAELELDNVRFGDLVPTEKLPGLLASADCHLVVQRKGAADAVLPSKLTNILAVGGNSIITAEPQTTLGKLMIDFPGIAVSAVPEDLNALIGAIEAALDLPKFNVVAFEYAQHHLDRDAIIETFLDRVGRGEPERTASDVVEPE